MWTKNLFIYLVLLFSFFINACKSAKTVGSEPTSIESPQDIKSPVGQEQQPDSKFSPSPYVMREFRAAWIATVANINWPSKPGLSTQEQQEEALKLLDFLKDHNYNAVIFQVRPQADAMYNSHLEPWSYFLSGEVGKAPEPWYDPLSFWIDAAHDRGLELHVWLNPYRSHHTTGGELSPKSLVQTHPEIMVSLKNGMWWMDPSKTTTQDHSAAVVMDIVKRYDVDGVHFDDYFYPYASYNDGLDFPDAESYQNYLKSGGTQSIPEWRREAVNTFVKRIYTEIKAEKPEVKFGLSPFGIWRPGHPESIAGMDQYNELYADAKLWLNKGWIDYFTPQLYWKINQAPQSFPVLLGWWKSENTLARHLWPGISLYHGGGDDNVDETINQIMITRGMLPESMGTVHWSISPLLNYPKLAQGLLEGPYKKPALVPASPWLNTILPEAPTVATKIVNNKVVITWDHPQLEDVFKWVVFYKYDKGWDYKILDRTKNSAEISLHIDQADKQVPLTTIGVTAVDKTGNQSSFNEIRITMP
ncbi:glycoside hydrolase family 10 protein [Gelidibacter sp.]|uniref:glycoside hydrolase family 10 protein n=1 Tax=Gelidibacter sp. TaxID=2018083 RepID=UPI002BA42E0D|nr:family 10 glycosylhydrolase [Gelidibacter sp.]HUH27920.1 family 10 glycosylhydrolase [Gelidibacter sp.]